MCFLSIISTDNEYKVHATLQYQLFLGGGHHSILMNVQLCAAQINHSVLLKLAFSFRGIHIHPKTIESSRGTVSSDHVTETLQTNTRRGHRYSDGFTLNPNHCVYLIISRQFICH